MASSRGFYRVAGAVASMEAGARGIVEAGGGCQVPGCTGRAVATRTTWSLRTYAVCGAHAAPRKPAGEGGGR